MNSEIFAFRCSQAKQLQERINQYAKANGLLSGAWIARVLQRELDKVEKKGSK